MKRSLHRFALRLFGLIPWPVQRVLIGVVKTNYVAGSSAVVMDGAGRILLVRHSYRQGWSTPGGFLNRGEQAADAVVREVWEEVGLRVAAYDEQVVVLRTDDRIVEFVQRLRLVDEATAADVRAVSAEIDEVRWFALDALPELATVTQRVLDALDGASARRAQP